MTTDEIQPAAAVQISTSSVPKFYTSFVQLTANPQEVVAILAMWGIPELGGGPPAPPAPVAAVHMSPQTAKVLLTGLTKVLEAYEEKFGEIALPKELLAGQDTEFIPYVGPKGRA